VVGLTDDVWGIFDKLFGREKSENIDEEEFMGKPHKETLISYDIHKL
jgi:hypothetical protein